MLKKRNILNLKKRNCILLQWATYSRHGIFNLQCILELADASAPRINNEAHAAPKEF